MGSATAFEELVPFYARKLYSIAFAILQDKQASEEVIDEVFLRAYHDRNHIPTADDFPLWLVSATRDIARDFYRKRHVEPTTDDARIHEVIRHLPEKEREAVTQKFLDNVSYSMIEGRLGLQHGSVRGIMSRTLKLIGALPGISRREAGK